MKIKYKCEDCKKVMEPSEDTYNLYAPILRHHLCKDCNEVGNALAEIQKEKIELTNKIWANKERGCPKCGNKHTSVKDRGQCNKCFYTYYASHPDLGDTYWYLNED
jgi:ribosomal protein S27AE